MEQLQLRLDALASLVRKLSFAHRVYHYEEQAEPAIEACTCPVAQARRVLIEGIHSLERQ